MKNNTKQLIANQVVQSVLNAIEGEIEHYMFMSGEYNETDNNFMRDQSTILKIVTETLIKK